MSKDQRFFYGTWAFAWFMLGCIASIVLYHLPGSQKATFNLEAWFVSFPVAWTVALLVVRYKENLREFFQYPLVIRFLAFLILMMKAWSWWTRDTPHRNSFDKPGSVVLAIASLYFLWSFVVEAVKMWRGRKQRIRA